MKESRRPKNEAEGLFCDAARSQGWKLTKRGWPDFLCWGPDGSVFVVEVKPSGGRVLKREQAAILQFLADHGIPAYRWSPDTGFVRVRTDPKRHARARSRVLFEAPQFVGSAS